MANRKPWTARILNAATKEDSVNRSMLRRRLRLPSTEMDSEQFNRGPGRSLTYLAKGKYLKRTDRGEYTITKKGERTVAAY